VSGWWATARRNAESQILSELVFLPPEEGLAEEEGEADRLNPVVIAQEIDRELREDMEEEMVLEQLAWDQELAEMRRTEEGT